MDTHPWEEEEEEEEEGGRQGASANRAASGDKTGVPMPICEMGPLGARVCAVRLLGISAQTFAPGEKRRDGGVASG